MLNPAIFTVPRQDGRVHIVIPNISYLHEQVSCVKVVLSTGAVTITKAQAKELEEAIDYFYLGD